MDYQFTKEEMAFKREVAEFVRAQLPADWESRVLYWPGGYGTWPFAEAEFRTFYLEFNRKLGEKGWLSLAWPREFAGSNSMIKQAIVDDVTSYYRVPAGGAAQLIAGPIIIAVGSPKMKDQWLPRIARGEVSIWLGYSEPNAGSDLGALQTRAKDKRDHFVINGQKTWSTGAHATDYCWLLARTDPEAGKHAGATLFLVDNNTPGITIRPIINICQTHSFNEVFFDDVKVPKENVVGEVNRGFQHVMLALQYERLAVSTGAFRRFLEELVQYCRGNRRHGLPLAESPLIRDRMAAIATEIEMLYCYYWYTAWMIDQGRFATREASAIKLFATELSKKLADAAMDILGPYGPLHKDSWQVPLMGRVGLGYLDAVSGTLGAGTSEIQRSVIATRGLGLPR